MTPGDTRVTSLEMYEPTFAIGVEEYEPYVGSTRVEELKHLAAPLQGKRWASISSTLVGGEWQKSSAA